MNEQSEDEQEGGESTAAPLLTTARLHLRAPRMNDIEAIAGLANNLKIAEQTRRMPYPYTRADAEHWIGSVSGSPDMTFLVNCAQTGSVIGAAGCGIMEDNDLEVGYWIGEPHWGKGYATEAVQAVIDHIFDLGRVDRLYGRCRVVNMASRRVLMKCGFQFVGSGMCDSRTLRGLVPVEEFALERSVWVSLKRWGKAS